MTAVQVLLPINDRLSEEQRSRALEWIVARWDVLKLNADLCTALSATAFVTAGALLLQSVHQLHSISPGYWQLIPV